MSIFPLSPARSEHGDAVTPPPALVPRPRTSTEDAPAATPLTPSIVDTYRDEAFDIEVNVVNVGHGFLGYIGVLIDDDNDDQLFVCIVDTVPVEDRPAAVRSLIVSWVRQHSTRTSPRVVAVR